MITLNVHNQKGDTVGTVDVDPEAFGGEVNRQLLHDVVLMYQANVRRGTHSTLRRGEVAGSTKKLFRQKGTGNARVGTRRTNKRRGGGTAKGPKPRDYEYHLPKKAVRAATRMAILSKFQDNEAVVVDQIDIAEPRTKLMAGVLKALRLKGISCLIGIANPDKKLHQAARNIEGVKLAPTKEFNAYDVLKQKRLLLTKDALEALKKGSSTATSGSD